MKIRLPQGEGLVRHLSASDIYFTTSLTLARGAALRFELEIVDPAGPLWVDCAARIVRVERLGGQNGVAATISKMEFRRIPEAANDAAMDNRTGTTG